MVTCRKCIKEQYSLLNLEEREDIEIFNKLSNGAVVKLPIQNTYWLRNILVVIGILLVCESIALRMFRWYNSTKQINGNGKTMTGTDQTLEAMMRLDKYIWMNKTIREQTATVSGMTRNLDVVSIIVSS